MRRIKRMKTSQGSSYQNDNDDTDEYSNCSDEDALEDDPILELQHDHRKPDAGLVPILRHVLEIQYTKDERHNNDQFKNVQATLSILSNPNTIDLGDFRFAEHRGSAVAMAYHPQIHGFLLFHHSLLTGIQMIWRLQAQLTCC